MRQRWWAAALGVAVGLVAAPAAAAGFVPDRLVVFGDSLVDAGNAYLGTKGATAQPGYGYFDGRFSNGPVFTDLVNARLTEHATGSTTNYTVPFLAGGSNFAVGGAQAAMDRQLLGFTVPGLASQLGIFQASHQPIDPNALYVLNFGGNDVSAIEAGEAAAGSPQAAAMFAQQYTAEFVGNFVGGIEALENAGARHFLIGGVPIPSAAGIGLEAALQQGLATVPLAPNASLQQIDYFGFLAAITAHPAAFGLPATINTDFSTPCVVTGSTPGVTNPPPPTDPHPNCTNFVSFDGDHPTAPVHAALAHYIDGLIGVPLAVGGVPEPATWGLMVMGFGLIGAAVRRRSRNLIALA